MKRFLCLLLLLATGVSAGAHAAPSAELRVTGVIRPAACTPTLAGAGVVDYGNIPASQLRTGQATPLAARQLTLTVNCNAAAKIALVVVDNRATSRVPGITDAVQAGAHYNFGLGSVAGKNVGGYTLSFDSGASGATADTRAVTSIVSADNGSSWSAGNGFIRHDGQYFSFTDNSGQPVAQQQLSATIKVQPFINKAENLPTGQDIPLDGAATIEIKYL